MPCFRTNFYPSSGGTSKNIVLVTNSVNIREETTNIDDEDGYTEKHVGFSGEVNSSEGEEEDGSHEGSRLRRRDTPHHLKNKVLSHFNLKNKLILQKLHSTEDDISEIQLYVVSFTEN